VRLRPWPEAIESEEPRQPAKADLSLLSPLVTGSGAARYVRNALLGLPIPYGLAIGPGVVAGGSWQTILDSAAPLDRKTASRPATA
jgi:hypothetical protein